MIAMGIDLGRLLGFGVLGRGIVRSGTHEVCKTWQPLGASLILLRACLESLISKHKPTILGVARPFVRRGRGGAMVDTPQNLVPMFGAFATLHIVAADAGIPIEIVQESEARKIMLGAGMPAGSAKIKEAIIQAVRDRGWPATDFNAADALCVAAALVERLEPSMSHQTTPLFQKRKRR